ncbi:3,4-dihydroxy-2-butanone-4-phosphate synthase [Oceanobacillus arenosus]|uniref:3,4-dihydroxy-2-butanone 4-phosphate synthase n=1 Tax=Oceanobacillus arenosus TaxID=1229153 RepID=A0A3D8PW21_9BACI|nr:3,4-dihydroxy-2-butanone-4-phosphate synthase [Oceanobacillus arenosus]
MVDTIEEAIIDLRDGKPIIVVDDENRENEGDFIALSEKATPEVINFMITHGKGLVCVPIEADHAKNIGLTMMVDKSTDPLGTAFTVSVDHIDTTTGISALERSRTVQALANPAAKITDFKQPGHMFPLIAKDGGVLTRPGHTEAAVDLAKLSDSFPSGVICEIIKEDGKMARLPELKMMAKDLGLKIITIADLIVYRKKKENEATLNA